MLRFKNSLLLMLIVLLVSQVINVPGISTNAFADASDKNQQNLMLKDSFAKIKDGTMETFLQAIKNGACTVVFWGDSITAGANRLSLSAMWVENIKEKLQKTFPNVKFTFHNLAISGLTSSQAADANYIVAKNSTSWANEDNKTWQYYINKTQPHLVLVAFGMNPTSSMTAQSMYNVNIASFLNSIASNPSYVFLTNWVARKEWADAKIGGGWRTIENMARSTRYVCESLGYSYLDIHRVYKILVDGKDDVVKNSKLETGGDNWTVINNLYVYNTELMDFELSFYADVSATSTIRIQFRKESCIDIPQSGHVGFYYPGSVVNVDKPLSDLGTSIHKFNLKVIGTKVSLYVDDMLVAEKTGHGDFGDGYVRFGYIFGTGNISISNTSMLSYQPFETFPSLTEDELVGTYDPNDIATKLPYGGNGINHPTSSAVNLLYNDALQDFVDYAAKSVKPNIVQTATVNDAEKIPSSAVTYEINEQIKKSRVYNTTQDTGIITSTQTTQEFITAMQMGSILSFSHVNDHAIKLSDMPKPYGQVLLIKSFYVMGFFFSTDGNFYKWNQSTNTWVTME